MSEAVNRERSAGGCHQKGQVSAFRRGDDLGEARMSWDRQLGAGFLLRYRQDAFADVLRPHAHDVAAALAGVEQKPIANLARDPIGCRASYCSISVSVHVWMRPAFALAGSKAAVGSRLTRPVATANCINPRRAVSQFRAAKGFFAPRMAATCCFRSLASLLSPCSVRKLSRISRRFFCVPGANDVKRLSLYRRR